MWFTLLVVVLSFLAGWLLGPRVAAWVASRVSDVR